MRTGLSRKLKALVRWKLATNAVQLELTNSVIKHLGRIGILRLRLSGMVICLFVCFFNFVTILTTFCNLVALVCIKPIAYDLRLLF